MIFAPQIGVIVFAAYLLGSIPFGLLVAKSRGIDIRQHGSGNIGATNVLRVLGKVCGLITFACDAAKGFIAVIAGKWLAEHWPSAVVLPHGHTQTVLFSAAAAGIAAALGCIIGHSFPVWLGFKGGKGVATSLGVLLGMMPLASFVVLAFWGVVFKLSRYVSLASLLAALALPVVVIGFLIMGWMTDWAYFYFALAAAFLVILRHRGNIQRLVSGSELRFGEKAEATAPETETKPGLNGSV